MQYLTMNNGLAIPQMGYGVFLMSSKEVEGCLPAAIEMGYTHIDTANAYFNEVAVGKAIKVSGVKRESLFVTTKLFPQDYGSDVCMHAIDDSLRRLDMDYVDLLLLHQPYGAYTEAWKVLEQAVACGKVRSIGLSNFPKAKYHQILDIADILPAATQIEIHPRWNQHAFKKWLAPTKVVFEGWYPLGHGDRSLINAPVFARLAEKYQKTNAQIILRWHMQEGNIVFPKTTNPNHMRANLDIFDFALTDAEVSEINTIPQKAYYTIPDETPAFVRTHYDYDHTQA